MIEFSLKWPESNRNRVRFLFPSWSATLAFVSSSHSWPIESIAISIQSIDTESLVGVKFSSIPPVTLVGLSKHEDRPCWRPKGKRADGELILRPAVPTPKFWRTGSRWCRATGSKKPRPRRIRHCNRQVATTLKTVHSATTTTTTTTRKWPFC